MRCVCVAKEERCFATNDRDERANVVAISQSAKLSNSADRGNVMNKKKKYAQEYQFNGKKADIHDKNPNFAIFSLFLSGIFFLMRRKYGVFAGG